MSNYTRWYRVGNVKLVHDSRTVEGTDTYWLTAGLNPGDLFTIDGAQFYEVDSITDNTHLTLKNTYGGVSAEDSPYSIIRNFTATMPADIAARTAELLGDFRKYIDTDMRSIHGKSAYELAIENGYTGTQQQWLDSLKAAGEWDEMRSELTSFENTTDDRVTALETGQGTLANLNTTAKTSLVLALNELLVNQGALSGLSTSTKTSLIAAINEVLSKVGTVSALNTETKTNLTAAVNEVNTAASLNAANIGALSALTTDEQGSIVGAINELDKRIHYLRKWWNGDTGWDTLNTTISDVRNTQFRGKCLGEKPTAAQWDSIQQGTFEDMYIGDYWSGVDGSGPWTILHFNYFRDTCAYYVSQFNSDAEKWRFMAQCHKSALDWEYTPNHVVVWNTSNGIKGKPYVAEADWGKKTLNHYASYLYKTDEYNFWERNVRPVFGYDSTHQIEPHIYNGLPMTEQCDNDGFPTGVVHGWTSLYLPSFDEVFGYHPACNDGKVHMDTRFSVGDPNGGTQADTPVQFAYFRLHTRRRDYWGDSMFLRSFGGYDANNGRNTVWVIPKWEHIGYRNQAQRKWVSYTVGESAATMFKPWACIAGGSDLGVA